MANTIQLQTALQKPYDTILFGKDVLRQVFGSGFTLNSSPIPVAIQPNQTEKAVIHSVFVYGNINLEDGTEITCYEVVLQPSVRIEHSRVAIQHYVRKLLTAGQMALINFIPTELDKAGNLKKGIRVWRLTLVAKDSELTDEGLREKVTHAKRYTYLLGPSETCRTPAQRLEQLSIEPKITFQKVREAFEVEKLSDEFFEEYTRHYERLCKYLQESNFRKSVFKISITKDASDEERDKAFKPIRDFVKKLLGRIVFLYFVQKKGWLGSMDTNYKDGLPNFIKQLFFQSGGNDSFYSNWLTVLFFDTLNKERQGDDFKMPDGKKVKVPFLNGGLFDQEEFDDALLTIPSKLFHNKEFFDVTLDKKNFVNSRGFFDFLDSYNFTVYEDGPDDHTVAVDPEMLGHIFENLLEDNKDKGTFYTPKEIVHYMCQESLTEYLATSLKLDNEDAKEPIRLLVKDKELNDKIKHQLTEIDALLDTVKICDPAIGSGAFPMGLLQEIHGIKEVIAFSLNKAWKPAEVKENIIQNSIYGVDVEKGAVDIARLRFWLSLVVDEDMPRALPNLDYKIVVGDSLVSKFEGDIIEVDWERKQYTSSSKPEVEAIQGLLKKIAEGQKAFFKPSTRNKKSLQSTIRTLKVELLIKQLKLNRKVYESKNQVILDSGFGLMGKDKVKNEEIILQIDSFKKTLSKLEKLRKDADDHFDHFDWQLDFPEVLNANLVDDLPGFDIVIANPPYVSIEGIQWDDRRYYETKYKTATGRFDLYALFIEKALNLKNKKGILTYIIPGKFLNNKQLAIARKMLCQHNSVSVVKIDEKVFKAAQVDSVIIKSFLGTEQQYKAYKFSKNKLSLVSKTSIQDVLKDKQAVFRIETNSEYDDLIARIEEETYKVKEIAEVKDGIVAGTVKDVLFLDYRKDSDSHKLYFGKHLSKYYLSDTEVWVNYKPDEMMKVEVARKAGKRPGLWMRDQRIFLREKILSRFVAKEIIATYDNEQRYYEHTLHSTHITDKRFRVKFVLAVFNSSLFKFYYQKTNSQGGDLFPQVRISSVENMPIKLASSSIQQSLEIIVDYVLALKKQETKQHSVSSMSSYFERLIDAAVYELYLPEVIKPASCEISKYLTDLPDISNKVESESLKLISDVYSRLTTPSHPVDAALLKLNNVPEVQIIEGKQ